MQNTYKAITSHILSPRATFYKPVQGSMKKVTLDSPALDVMTDLTLIKAITIKPDMPIYLAQTKMLHTEVRLLLVTDAKGIVVGLLSIRDILSDKPTDHMTRHKVSWDKVLVQHIMTCAEKIQVLDFDDVARASVGDVALTLEQSGRQHALAVDRFTKGAEEIIRGIFSASQINIQLGQAAYSTAQQDFAQLETLMRGPARTK